MSERLLLRQKKIHRQEGGIRSGSTAITRISKRLRPNSKWPVRKLPPTSSPSKINMLIAALATPTHAAQSPNTFGTSCCIHSSGERQTLRCGGKLQSKAKANQQHSVRWEILKVRIAFSTIWM